jgi:hypothetical protein
MCLLIRTVLLVFLLVLLAGCPVTPRPVPVKEDNRSTGEYLESEEFFVDGEAEGETVFMANSEELIGPRGYTLWRLDGTYNSPFSGSAMVLSKISGHDLAGYGILFCHSETTWGESMLIVMLNTLGEYIVGKVVGDAFYEILPWSESSALVRGYNQANRVEISFDAGQYRLRLNGTNAAFFRDEEEPVLSGGRGGFIAVISPLEVFPGQPVHILYRKLP